MAAVQVRLLVLPSRRKRSTERPPAKKSFAAALPT